MTVLIIFLFFQPPPHNEAGQGGEKECLPKERATGSHGWLIWICGFLVMILPQVHLRKPCYDFYFL
jgi:hypothetical protein